MKNSKFEKIFLFDLVLILLTRKKRSKPIFTIVEILLINNINF